MNQHHYQRIDKGVRRNGDGIALEQPRSEKGTFLPICSAERRSEIIQSVPGRIRAGETTTQIAVSEGLQPRTLRSWLIGNEDVEGARGDFLASELAEAAQEIEDATEPLPLARARERFRAWAWIAERREARLYGAKQEVTHELGQSFTQALTEISRKRQELPQEPIDITPKVSQDQ